jgi:hypothetical protein
VEAGALVELRRAAEGVQVSRQRTAVSTRSVLSAAGTRSASGHCAEAAAGSAAIETTTVAARVPPRAARWRLTAI